MAAALLLMRRDVGIRRLVGFWFFALRYEFSGERESQVGVWKKRTLGLVRSGRCGMRLPGSGEGWLVSQGYF